jgi:6-phosphogluconate dehydrogenase
MIGGDEEPVRFLEPVFRTLAPKDGFLHCGKSGSGHLVKMIHNGIEYGMMQAYAEGFDILRASPYGLDLQKIAHLWNQGSVVRSWLLELADSALSKDPRLENLEPFVADSGEGRWTVFESIERDVPAPVLTLALQARFASREKNSFAHRLLAALRNEFGGHAVKKR